MRNFIIGKTEYFLNISIWILALLIFSPNLSFSQCTGCNTTISTNVAGNFTANNQVVCITSNTYSSDFNFQTGPYTGGTLCIASNVNWSGGSFTQATNPTTINLYGIASYGFVGWNGISSGVVLNVKSGAQYTGTMQISAGGTVNVDGVFNPSSTNLNAGIGALNISNTGTATISGGTVGVIVNNQGTLYSPITTTFNQPTTLSGTVIINGTAAYNSSLVIGGNVTIRGDFAINSTNLTVLSNATLSITGNVSINATGQTNLAGNVIVNGTFTQNAGTLNQSGSFQVGGLVTLNASTTLTGNNTFGSLTQNTGTLTQGSGSTQINGAVTTNGTVIGGGGGCGLFCPSGTWTNNGTISAGTGLALCQSPTTGTPAGAGVGVFNPGSTSQPRSLTITATTSGYQGAFTIATNTGTNGYIVVRNAGSQPAPPTSFTNYVAGSVVSGNTIVVAIISPRTVSSFIDIQPSSCGSQYFYSAYAYQNSTTTGTACGSLFYINSLSPATASFTPTSLGTTNSITGSTSVCSNGTRSYSTNTVSGASGYLWSYSGAGVSITSTTTSAILTFNSTATSGILTVRGFSACATSAGSTLTLTLTSPPTIVTQPTSATICGGNTRVFTVSATGSSLTYLWSNGSANQNITVSGAGNYTATVSGSCGNAISNTVSLTTLAGTSIVTQPTSASICGGNTNVFTVSATGSSLTYLWSNGTANQNITVSGIGNYTVTVSGSCGNAISNTVSLTTLAGTSIVTQPSSATICGGNTRVFTVSATGSSLTYLWSNGTANQNITVSGASNYTATVSGTCGNAISNTVSLTTLAGTSIVTQPTSASICGGNTRVFTVSATGSSLTYLWSNGTATQNITVSGIGNYTVTVSGSCGNAISNTVTLSTLSGTSIVTQPTSATICGGNTRVFTVSATGSSLTYLWSNGTASQNITVSGVGNYTVTVSGTCGNAISNTVSLSTLSGASIVTQPVTSNICNGNNHLFTVSSSGTTLSYTWQYFFSGSWFDVLFTVGSNGTVSGSSLTLNSTAGFILNSNNVRVLISNACGTATSNGLSIVNNITSPTITSPPSSATICGSSALFSVSANANGGTNSFNWQLSTNLGVSWIALTNGGNYNGVTTSQLTVSGVTSAMNGHRFRNAVFNGCFTTTSLSAVLNVNATGQWLGTVNSDWSNASNWCVQPTLTTDNATISSSASIMPIITTSSVNIGGITIGTSASLTLQGFNTMTLSGNFINNGTFFPNSGKVSFSGTSAQVISGSGVNLFSNIDINNTTSVTLGNTISVSGTMTLGTNGKYSSGGFTTVFLSTSTTSSTTARLAALPTGATFSGNITMQRFIPPKPTLRLMSSAVRGSTLNDWKATIPITGIGGASNSFDPASANINTVWYFNEAINAPTTNRYVGAPNINMALSTGAGYRVFIRGNRNSVNLFGAYTVTSVVMSVTNPPNTGTVNLPVTYTNYNAPFRDGTNLVGNPYPCEINWDAAGWTKTNIDNALYMWDPNLGINGQYYYYVGGVASPSRTNPGIIASSQGFFVKANAASPVLRLTEAVKTVAGHTSNFRTSNSNPSDVIRLQLKDTTSNFDEAVVRFVDGASSSFDKDYDAYKLYNSSLNIFSNPVTGTDLSINALGTDITNVTVPLSVFSTKKGRYSIQASGLDNFPNGVNVYLQDSYLNTLSEMTNDSKYDFNISSDSKSSGANRFSLVVYRSMITTGTDLLDENYTPTLKLYPNPNSGTGLTLELYNFKEANVELVVKDISGRILITKNLQTDNLPYFQTELSDFGSLSNGVYFVTLNTSKTHFTEKVILVK